MNYGFIICTLAALMLSGCNNSKQIDELKESVKEQRVAQNSTAEQVRESTAKVNELLIRNEAMLRQLDKMAELEKKLEALETTRLEALKEAMKPRNTTVESAIESSLKLTTLTDPEIRKLTCPLLSKLGGKVAEDKLVELVNEDRESSVRAAALRGLVEMNSKRVTPLLNEAILTAEGNNLYVVTEYLNSHCDESSRKPVLAVLHTLKRFDRGSQENVRQQLYGILAQVGKPEDVTALKYFLEKERNKTEVMKALLAIDEKKAVALLNEAIVSAKKEHVRQLAQFMEKHANESSRPAILEALDGLVTSEDYNARQAREYLYRAFAEIAKPEDNVKIEKWLRLESGDRRGLLDLYVKTGETRKKAVFTQLERSLEGYNQLSKGAFLALAEYVDIRATDFLVAYMSKHNDYQTSPVIVTMLLALKDPKAASTLIAWQSRGRSQTRRIIQNALMDGFPGTVYNKATKKTSLVSAEKMKVLMEQREKTILELETVKAVKKKPEAEQGKTEDRRVAPQE